jgi:hypothetical protein
LNSSLHTSVFGGMCGPKARLAAGLACPPETAMAFTVRSAATRKGAKYCGEAVVGSLPSRV